MSAVHDLYKVTWSSKVDWLRLDDPMQGRKVKIETNSTDTVCAISPTTRHVHICITQCAAVPWLLRNTGVADSRSIQFAQWTREAVETFQPQATTQIK